MRLVGAVVAAFVLAPAGDRLPEFVFTNYDGRAITGETLAGKTTVVVPTYAKCITACPVVTFVLDQMDHELGAPDHLQFLLISVQPDEDTRDEILLHFEKHEIDARADRRWLFANGPVPAIEAFLADAGVEIRRIPVDGGHLVEHTIVAWVVGPDGSVARTFDTYFWNDEEMRDALRATAD